MNSEKKVANFLGNLLYLCIEADFMGKIVEFGWRITCLMLITITLIACHPNISLYKALYHEKYPKEKLKAMRK